MNDFCDYGLRLSRDYAATMTDSHRRRIRREPDVFFAESPAEILQETERKNGRSISAGAERAKQGTKEHPKDRQIMDAARRLWARQYRGQRCRIERRQSGLKWPVLEQKKSALLGRDLVGGQKESRQAWAAPIDCSMMAAVCQLDRLTISISTISGKARIKSRVMHSPPRRGGGAPGNSRLRKRSGGL